MSIKKNALGVIRKTQRNFPYIEFKDYYDEPCTLQLSSIILGEDEERWQNPGTSAVWLGRDDNGPHSHRMHLSRKQVAALVHTLQKWLRTGKLE